MCINFVFLAIVQVFLLLFHLVRALRWVKFFRELTDKSENLAITKWNLSETICSGNVALI